MGMSLGKSGEEFKSHLTNKGCEFLKEVDNALYFKGVFSGCDAFIGFETTPNGKVYKTFAVIKKNRFGTIYDAYKNLKSTVAKKYATFKNMEDNKEYRKRCIFFNRDYDNGKIINIEYEEDYKNDESLVIIFEDSDIEKEIHDMIEGDI